MILRRLAEAFRRQDWFAVLIETLIVVTGIFIGVQATDWANDRAEQKQIRVYLVSLRDDLAADREMLGVIVEQINDTIADASRLADYSRGRPLDTFDNLELVLAMPGGTYRPFAWNRTTFSQLKSIGAVRQIRNPDLRTLVAEYEALADHLDLDFKSDERRYDLVSELSYGVVDYNYADYEALARATLDGIAAARASPAYEKARGESRTIIAEDIGAVQELVSAYVALARLLNPRVSTEIPKLIEIGREIESIIEADYADAGSSRADR